MTDAELHKVICNVVRKMVWVNAGDHEETMSEAYFIAAKALKAFDGRGSEASYVGYRIRLGLLKSFERRRDMAKTHTRWSIHEKQVVVSDPQTWLAQLLTDLSGDAATVLRAAIDAPGEVAECLMGSGWSGSRLIAAMDEVAEAIR